MPSGCCSSPVRRWRTASSEFRSPGRAPAPGGRGASAERRALGVEAFRRAAAPVYLRRNQQDVLTELPELVQVDEWEEFGAADGAAYRTGGARRQLHGDAPGRVRRHGPRLGEARPAAGDRRGGRWPTAARSWSSPTSATCSRRSREALGTGRAGRSPARRSVARAAADRGRVHAAEAGAVAAGARSRRAASGSTSRPPRWSSSASRRSSPPIEAQADRPGPPDGPGAHGPGAPPADRGLRRPADARAARAQAQLFDAYAGDSAIADAAPEATDAEIARQVIAAERERLLYEPPAVPAPDDA